MFNTARITDLCTHGARLKTGSGTRLADGLPVVRLGDLVDCPIHGLNPIQEIIGGMPFTDGLPTAHGTAKAKCGAEIIVNVTQGAGSGGGGHAEVAESIAMETEDMTKSQRRAYLRSRFGASGAAAIERTLDQSGSNVESDDVAAANLTSKIVGCEDFSASTPDSTRISKYFTVGMLSSQIYQGSNAHSIPAKTAKGLTRAAVICNLKHLATNSLDPAIDLFKAQGFTIKVGSGFRNASNGSDHNIGSAADLHVFKGGQRVSRSDLRKLAEMCCQKLPFTQIILEFAGSSSAGWIHLANRRNGQNSALRVCYTMTGGSPYHSGLPRV